MEIPPPDGPAGATDEDLVERVRRGDAAAFDELVSRHMRRAFSLAFRVLGHREDTEDLVQDAFVVLLDRVDTFQQGRRFAPWFFRIVMNRALNARRARGIRRGEEIPPDVAAPTPSPERTTEQAEVREHVGRALAGLPEQQRLIVRLFELEGFSSREIAEMLDIPDGTVRWHLHRARAALRQALTVLGGRAG